jgi:hypothetical protein
VELRKKDTVEETVEVETETQKGVFIDEDVVVKDETVDSFIELNKDEKEEVLKNLSEVAPITERPKYSREVIKENLDIIESNLNQAPSFQKALLFVKQAELIAMNEAHDAFDLLEK